MKSIQSRCDLQYSIVFLNSNNSGISINPLNFRLIDKSDIDIQTLNIMQGKLSPKVRSIVIEQAFIHQKELMNNRKIIEEEGILEEIEPLE